MKTTNRYNLMLTHLRAVRNQLDIIHDELNMNVSSFCSPRVNKMRRLLADLEEELQWLQYHMSKHDDKEK